MTDEQRQQAARELARQLYETGGIGIDFALAAVLEVALEHRLRQIDPTVDRDGYERLALHDAAQALGALFYHFGDGNICGMVKDWAEKHDADVC